MTTTPLGNDDLPRVRGQRPWNTPKRIFGKLIPVRPAAPKQPRDPQLVAASHLSKRQRAKIQREEALRVQ